MLSGKIGVTLARNAGGSALRALAESWAEQLGAVFLERPDDRGVEALLEQHKLAALVVAQKRGPRIHSAAGSFAWHLGMAVLRLQQLQQGKGEHLTEALALRPGARVLDATLGLAADASIAACVVGDSGCVVGLEASPLLYLAVSYGLAHYEAAAPELTAALRRVQPVQAVAADYLTQCADDSFDVVYFDPMFRWPVQASNAMAALRPLAWEQPLEPAVLQQALRVAPRVVVKERSERLLRELGCQKFVGGRYSRVKYGIIRRGESRL